MRGKAGIWQPHGWLPGIRTAGLRRLLLPTCGQLGSPPGCPAWQTISVGHGFVWEGHRDVLHRDAIHNGGEGVQAVGVCGVSCEQVVCREKVEAVPRAVQGVPGPRMR